MGPITIDPNVQSRGIGRRLMEAGIERGRGSAIHIFELRDGKISREIVFDMGQPE